MNTTSSDLDPDDPNSQESNNAAFEVGGSFDLNNGRRQTRLFAEAFHRHVTIDLQPNFSILDVGCALGDALDVWHRKYPKAQLSGCDFSEVAVRRAGENYGHIANFYRAAFEEISENYDVIYCSNVLEHFSIYAEIAETLHRRCKILYILVPYMEFWKGERLSAETDHYHKATFDLSSFDQFAGASRAVVGRVIRAPGAWSPNLMGEARWLLRRYVKRKPGTAPRQALFELKWL